MPINRKWNMAELQEVLIDFPRSGNVPIMIEYVLIPGVNDADEHADELVGDALERVGLFASRPCE